LKENGYPLGPMDIQIKTTSEYKGVPLEESLRALGASAGGLSEAEAQKRLQVWGYNEIPEKKENPALEFLGRFWGPMPWLLELAMAISFVLGHYIEGGLIFFLLAVNAAIGFLHSRKSQKALETLKKRLSVKARALRDGTWRLLDAREVVPGDIITARLGDILPTDAQIISGDLSLDESALTGESLPVRKKGRDILYAGSIVRQGEAECLVLNTGINTYLGKTAQLVKIARPASHEQEVMTEIVKYMMYLGIAASLAIAVYALYMKLSVLAILTFMVIFLMGAVPVALPAVLAIVQALGSLELAGKGVLVTRLNSIEDAASVNVLCLDKTGTITENRLQVKEVVPLGEAGKEDVLRSAALASREEGMDIIDTVVIEYAKGQGIDLSAYKQEEYTPFNPQIKRSEAAVEIGGKRFKVMKGAPQVLFSLCDEPEEALLKANHEIGRLSKSGYRTIAVAGSEADRPNEIRHNEMKLLGLISFADPPRPDSKDMIEEMKKMGIRPIMLTGDSAAIAREIAREVGIEGPVAAFSDIRDLPPAEKTSIIEKSGGFAEIYPEDKYLIVKLLQSAGHMVGMTGDGVNDAPALKQAELGIAVSNATDVAKASASIVLTKPGVGVIVDAVVVSRQIYQRMLTWVINKVTKVIEFIGLLTVSFFLLHAVPLTLLGMALLVFANDFVTISLSTDNVKHTTNPNVWNVRNITLACLVPGGLLVLKGLAVLFAGIYHFHLDWESLRTLVMLNLVFGSQFRVLIVRERRHFWSSRPSKGLLISSAGTLIAFAALGIFGLLVPPSGVYGTLAVLAFSAIFTLGIDFPKYWMFRKFGL
jgi:H+-transporting ATPase